MKKKKADKLDRLSALASAFLIAFSIFPMNP
jgi:hypothetical protein